MKKHIKNIISGLIFGLALLGSFGLAEATWNTYPTDCPNPLSIGNHSTGEGVQDGTNNCWTKRTVSASAGDTINLAVFYDNTNGVDARYTKINLNKTPSGESTSFSFSGTLNSSPASLSLNKVTVNISSSQTLTYNQAKWFKNGSGTGTSVSGESAFGSGLSLGTIPKGEWGTVLISFKVSNNTTPEEVCSISSFTASDYSIDEGDSSTLSWSTNNCTSAKISNVGNVSTNGSKTVYPTGDTTYTLTAYGADGTSKTKSLTINVDPYIEPTYCSISSFTASDYSIDEGDSSTLSWSTDNCTSAKISNVGSVGTNGSKTVYPTSDTTYTLTAYGADGITKTKTLTINVEKEIINPENDSCVINSFKSSDSTIKKGESATISWSTSNCSFINIPGIGYGLSNSGSKVVNPTYTKTYTLSAYSLSSLFSTKTKSLTINVVEETVPEDPEFCSISSFSASRYSLNSNESTNLSWNTNNCTSVTLSGVGVVSSSGSKSVYPSSSTTYVLTGFNQNGSKVTSDIRITVNEDEDDEDCRIDFSASDTRIDEGDYTKLEWETEGCQDVRITDVGYVSSSGSRKVYPDEDTTYRLTAYDNNGKYFTDSVKIYVDDDDDEDDDCQIDSFTVSDSSVKYGDQVTLKWRTSDCDDVYISNLGYVDDDGSEYVNVYYSTTYTLRAEGPERTRTKNIKVNVGSSYNPTPVVNYNAEVVTTVATNITENSAYLNGLISSSSFRSNNVYFEYGESINLGSRTPSKVTTYDTNFNYYLTGLKANSIYYFRAVAEDSTGNVYRGSLQFFKTNGKIYVPETTTTTTRRTVVTQGKTVYGSASPLVLEIGNKYQTLNVGDEIEYFVHYKNISNSVLSYPMIQVYIPEGIEVKNISSGTYSERDRILSIPLPNLNPDDEGIVYVQAEVDSIDNQLSQIVTTAVLVYTNPNGAQENAMAYVLNMPGDTGNMLGASAFIGGFGNMGLVCWLLIILLILLIVLIVRMIYRKKEKEQVIVPIETKK